MDFISEEFFAARTGEVLEARLRDSGTFRQQMESLHEASKAFSKDSGMGASCGVLVPTHIASWEMRIIWILAVLLSQGVSR